MFSADEDYSQAFKFPLKLKIKARFYKFLPQTWEKLPCMSVELYGYEGKENLYPSAFRNLPICDSLIIA